MCNSLLLQSILIVCTLLELGDSRQCGFPGRPRNGTSTTSSLLSRPGDTARYACQPGFTLFGDEERVCLNSGIWAGRQPICALNLARKRHAQATLSNYQAELAVDGKPETCSYPPRTTETRWWRVDLSRDYHVTSLGVLTSKDVYQEFTVFVVKIMSREKSKYERCAVFKGRIKTMKIFHCNNGLGFTGRYIHIQDDRRDKSDYFGLCEVEVFSFSERLLCGEPEEPVFGHVTWSPEGPALYSCDHGKELTAEPNRTCEADGRWAGHAPQCKAIICKDPPEIPNTEVKLLNKSTSLNSLAEYTCKSGYSPSEGSVQVLSTCLSSGTWREVKINCELGASLQKLGPLQGTGWSHRSQETSDHLNDVKFGDIGIIVTAALCLILVLLIAIVSILFARRSKAHQAEQEVKSTAANELILNSRKDDTYDEVVATGYPVIVKTETSKALECKLDNTANPAVTMNNQNLFPRSPEHASYNTLNSFPSGSSYNSGLATDTDEELNYARVQARRDCEQGYETFNIQLENVTTYPQYETVCVADMLYPSDSNREPSPNKYLPDRQIRSNHISAKSIHLLPSALKVHNQQINTISLQPDFGDENIRVPQELLALYAQVDKTKKIINRCEGKGEEELEDGTPPINEPTIQRTARLLEDSSELYLSEVHGTYEPLELLPEPLQYIPPPL